MFRLISGPHFDADEARRMGEEAFHRSFCPEGCGPPDDGDRRQPRSDVGPASCACAGPRHPRHPRSARHAERGCGDRAGDPRFQARDVPGHGPRPAQATVGRHHRRDRRQRRAGRRRPRRARRRPTLVALDVEGVLVPEIWIAVAERTGVDELRLTTRGRAGLRRADAPAPRAARSSWPDDERDHRDDRRAGAAAWCAGVPRPAASADAGDPALRHVQPSSPAR